MSEGTSTMGVYETTCLNDNTQIDCSEFPRCSMGWCSLIHSFKKKSEAAPVDSHLILSYSLQSARFNLCARNYFLKNYVIVKLVWFLKVKCNELSEAIFHSIFNVSLLHENSHEVSKLLWGNVAVYSTKSKYLILNIFKMRQFWSHHQQNKFDLSI